MPVADQREVVPALPSIEPSTGTLAVHVAFDDGSDPRGITVNVRPRGGDRRLDVREARTDATGCATLADLAPGRVQVDTNRLDSPKTVDVVAGSTARLDIRIAVALAAFAPWLDVYAIEPQPHCAAFISLAVQASGFGDSITVLNRLAGTASQASGTVAASTESVEYRQKQERHGYATAGVRDPTAPSVAIPRRTGCRGTWPYSTNGEQDAVKRAFANVAGALDPVNITYVDPSTLVSPDDEVLYVKVDTEGFEEEVFQALEPLLKRRQIANIMMELNKAQRMRAIGRFDAAWNSTIYLHDEPLLAWFRSLLERFLAYGYRIVSSHGTYRYGGLLGDAASVASFVSAEWTVADVWIIRPDETRKPTKE